MWFNLKVHTAWTVRNRVERAKHRRRGCADLHGDCSPYSNVMREDPSADLQSLSRGHAELDVEQITASGIADGYDRWMLQLPLRGDRKEATVYFLGATDSS